RIGDAVEHLFLLGLAAINKITLELSIALHVEPNQPTADLRKKLSASKTQPIIDELRNARLSSAAAALIGGNNEIAEQPDGLPLVLVQDLRLIGSFSRRRRPGGGGLSPGHGCWGP